jgi:HSP20 family protein
MKNTMTKEQTNCCQAIQHNLDEMIEAMAPGYRVVRSDNRCLSELAAPPVLEVSEDAQNYYVEAVLPNTANPDLNVEVTQNELIITGSLDIKITCDNTEETCNTKYTRANISFERAILIPDCISRKRVTARMGNGRLDITLPKMNARSNMIEVCSN